MNEKNRQGKLTDRRVENFLGNLLRTGVIVSAAVVLIGASLFLVKHGTDLPNYESFKGEPADLRSIGGIIMDAMQMKGRGIIQLGLLMLIATPVMRVLFSMFAFMRQGDKKYVVITFIVLSLLIYSLTGK